MSVQVIPDIPFPRIQSMEEDIASSSTKRLEGKVAIVTGGARGIGEATVRLFAIHGANVIIADVDDAPGNSLANSLSPQATYVHCDVTSEGDIENLVNSTVSKYGKLDILFNNAGILGDQSKKHKSILEFDANEFDEIMSVNVRGTALGTKHAARAMTGCGGGGCIISTASVADSYTASKHAIVGLTKNAACELGRYGIRVNCISPLVGEYGGCVSEDEEEKTEELETLKTKDIAAAVLFLASDESRYISGHNLVVDGGLSTLRNCVGL